MRQSENIVKYGWRFEVGLTSANRTIDVRRINEDSYQREYRAKLVNNRRIVVRHPVARICSRVNRM